MLENNDNKQRDEAGTAKQTRAFAAYYGLWIGICWALSFGLFIAGLSRPLLGNIGLLTGVCSFPLGVRLLRGFRDHIAPLPLRRAWHLSWMMFLAAAMICTAVQYIYFAYFDNGLLVRTYTDILQQPEMQDLVARMMPGQNGIEMMNDAVNIFAATPPSQLAFQFLFWNVLLATVLALPAALMAKGEPQSVNPYIR